MSSRPTRKTFSLGAGFRYSPYGQEYNPGAAYWLRVGQEMAKRFPGSQPEVIWIVSVVERNGTHLTFPGASNEPGVSFSLEDENEAALELFDQFGFRVWLQVEPGNARVETLFSLILQRYGRHPCVVGLGVDVEWHRSSSVPEGEPVREDEVTRWLAALRSHGGQYEMFLKHWKTDMLPSGDRQGILFVDDSQMFDSMDQMRVEFTQWGKHFYPSPVAYQIGYPADKKWWAALADPPKVIGDLILRDVPNTTGLFWVNFSVLEVFPP